MLYIGELYTVEEHLLFQPSFGEGLGTYLEDGQVLIQSSREMSVDGVCDVSCGFRVDHMFETEGLRSEFYGNVFQPFYRHLRCRVL